MKVQVYADVACPWCRLGKRRFAEAAERTGRVEDIELVHLPYQVDPAESEEAMPLAERMRQRYGENARAMFDEMTELGRREGLEFRFDHALAANTFAAHRVLAFVLRRYGARTQAAVADALSAMYFADGGNVADHGELAATAARHGVDPVALREHLASDQGVAELRARIGGARAEGITSVPTFVLDTGETLRGALDVQTYVTVLHEC